MKDVVSVLLAPINATGLVQGGYETDTGPWQVGRCDTQPPASHHAPTSQAGSQGRM